MYSLGTPTEREQNLIITFFLFLPFTIALSLDHDIILKQPCSSLKDHKLSLKPPILVVLTWIQDKSIDSAEPVTPDVCEQNEFK